MLEFPDATAARLKSGLSPLPYFVIFASGMHVERRSYFLHPLFIACFQANVPGSLLQDQVVAVNVEDIGVVGIQEKQVEES